MRIGVCVCMFAVLNWDKGKQSKAETEGEGETEQAKAKGKSKHFRLITNAQMMRA